MSGSRGTAEGAVPFPESLCHRCDAPPRYVRGARAIYLLCPRIPTRYPPQPVLACPEYAPREGRAGACERGPEAP